jgi:HPt (histidine-containing phosphotransfer) domain-containing protein
MTPQQYTHTDPQVLLQAAGNDVACFLDLSRTFLEIAPPMLTRLNEAVMAANCAGIEHESHSLRGTVLLVGATALAQLLKDMEIEARGGATQNCQHQMSKALSLFRLVEMEVHASILFYSASIATPPSDYH